MPAGTSISLPSIVTLGIVLLLALFRGQFRGTRADAALHLRPEMANKTLNGPRGRIAEGADRVTFDLPRYILERVDLLDARIARDHAFHDPPHPARAFPARRALA